MNLGHTIKRLRKQRGLKQYKFSEACGLTAAYLSLIEQNQKEPSLEALKKIAQALNLPIPVMLFLSLDEGDVKEDKRGAFKIIYPAVLAMIDGFFFSDSLDIPEKKRTLRTLTRADLPKKNNRKFDKSLHIEAYLKPTGEKVFICDLHYGDDRLCYLENAGGIPTFIEDLQIYEYGN